ncbi:hypothetical protein J437_LFUL006736 [Ladona fulva]|uniref:DENN domain-containing protein 5B n=1 Tax=Ladona fulva TaxID=123851 RepID=A0A8K0K1W3_LADFU|nr:hypothetical protein J437_LFUL006736 [Ladona fulva]
MNLPRNGKFSTLPNCSRRSASTDRNPKGNSNASPIIQPTKTSGDDQPALPPLPISVTFDMRNVQGMSEIKTDIGYARAWVRLSLEKKLLSAHLRTLLSDQALLRALYRRCAFLRCDDEKEQVVIFPMRKGGATTTSANAWVAAAGTLGGTNPVKVPKGHLEFVFHHKNLGILTTLRIGHDNTGPSPKWMVEHVIVRNEITGHSYKFPCGRWLGRGVDDDSTERLLVGEMIAWQSPDGTGGGTMGFGGGGGRARGSGSRMGSREDLLDADKGRGDLDQKRTPQHQRRGSIGSSEMTRCSTPPPPNPPPLVMSLFPSPTQFLQYSPPSLSPSTASSNRRRTPTVPEIQQMLGDAVNSIVKYYHRQKQEKEGLTMLLCGEMGLVHCLAQVFLYGFKSTRLFGKNLYLWDYFVKVKEEFLANRRDGEKREGRRSESKTREKSTVRQYCRLIEQICNSSRTLGKDGKFQLFICLGVREHLLHRMIGPLSSSRTTLEMFEDYSFLRNPSHSTFLSHILKSLDDFEFNLESSLTRGMMDTL